MSALAGSLILLGSLTALVLFTMVVENWSRMVQPLPGRTNVLITDERPEPSFAVPRSGAPERAVVVGSGSLHLRDTGTADVLAGVLFAAYAASRRTAADRAAAWVTAAAVPPSADPQRFPPGVVLRGRPSKVAELLAIRDGGVSWVTLQTSVDIATGVARRPVTQPTLAGLVSWWERTRSLPTVIRPTDAHRIADAVDCVKAQVDETPWSEPVGLLHQALRDAADRGEPVLVDLGQPADVAECDRWRHHAVPASRPARPSEPTPR